MKRTFTLSPTTLNEYGQCATCFWLKLTRGIKRPEGIFPSLPRGMDLVLKAHFDKHRSFGMIPKEIEVTGFSLFANQEKLDIWRNPFKGLQWTDSEGNILRGAPDDILEKEGVAAVLDHKTKGSAPTPGSASFYKLQLEVYTFLLRAQNGPVCDYGYLLYYFPNKVLEAGHIEFGYELTKVDLNPDHALSVFKDAIACLNGPLPKDRCDFCRPVVFGLYNTA
jgi:hypothetical protein